VLIYRYFVASATVPVNLVLPIWKSITASPLRRMGTVEG
jgi:hypothetical protein